MRDLGGLPTRDGRVIRPNRLIRSDNLGDLTAASIAHLVDAVDVRDVVDLRTRAEVEAEGRGELVALPGVTYHHHSLVADDPDRAVSAADLLRSWDHVDDTGRRDAAYWSGHYLGYLSRRPEAISASLRVVAASAGATIVHCAAGKDRTGTVVALALDVAGVAPEDIVADYLLSAERIGAIFDRLRTRPAYAAVAEQPASDQTPRAETMTHLLGTLAERYDGGAGWLLAQGWSSDDVDRLRRRLLD